MGAISSVEKRLDEAGYRMLGNANIEKLIIDILETKNTRYLKAIPFLLYKYDVDIKSVYSKISQRKLLTDLFGQIIGITNKIFTEFNIGRQIQFFSAKPLFSGKLNYEEFKDEFAIQVRRERSPQLLLEKQKIDAERNLQFWLSQIFTKKEKEILKNIIEGKPITKTDYEYYSRRAKKKLKAITYLEDFAKVVVEKTPIRNK